MAGRQEGRKAEGTPRDKRWAKSGASMVIETVTPVLPPRLILSALAVRDAARSRGRRTAQLPTFALPPELRGEHLHAGPAFADSVAPGLDIGLLQTPPDWLARLPEEFTGREITVMPIRDAYGLRRPAFAKSPNAEQIRAPVYADGSRLAARHVGGRIQRLPA